MYEAKNRVMPGRRSADDAGDGRRAPSKPVPSVVRATVRRFGWRDVRRVAAIRVVVAIWLVVLGSIFCVSGHWWGALLFVAAGANGWLAYQMPRWRRALDAERQRPAMG